MLAGKNESFIAVTVLLDTAQVNAKVCGVNCKVWPNLLIFRHYGVLRHFDTQGCSRSLASNLQVARDRSRATKNRAQVARENSQFAREQPVGCSRALAVCSRATWPRAFFEQPPTVRLLVVVHLKLGPGGSWLAPTWWVTYIRKALGENSASAFICTCNFFFFTLESMETPFFKGFCQGT